MVDRLFVYGTLREGQAARRMIAGHVARAEPATTDGALVAFPDYPGVVEGTGTIHGELVWLTDLLTAFALLDAYEGDDFLRILQRVRRQDGTEEVAWCYLLADPKLASAGTPIPHGDWLRWVRERDAD